MKRLIIVRHGYYMGKDLSKMGRTQMEDLGNLLRNILNGDTVQLLSSTAPRAVQSSEILATILGVSDFGKHEFLWSGPDSPFRYQTNLEAARLLINGVKAENVVVVTHLEYSERLPCFFATFMFGNDCKFPYRETEKGQAWVIDCVAKTCVKVPA